MSAESTDAVIRSLRCALGLERTGPPDNELLGRFVATGDPLAFEALVRRHGALVMGVCRRIVGASTDADDAFQATFLVLARKAAGIRSAIPSGVGFTALPGTFPGNWRPKQPVGFGTRGSC